MTSSVTHLAETLKCSAAMELAGARVARFAAARLMVPVQPVRSARETVVLLEDGSTLEAAANVVVSLIVALGATAGGYVLGGLAG
ncbi:MAG TPA: hypothetical protein VFI30_02620 [Nocardioidaceae bacterium]|nr:hypothetical protein [Nocardioidaceae bacterium]